MTMWRVGVGVLRELHLQHENPLWKYNLIPFSDLLALPHTLISAWESQRCQINHKMCYIRKQSKMSKDGIWVFLSSVLFLFVLDLVSCHSRRSLMCHLLFLSYHTEEMKMCLPVLDKCGGSKIKLSVSWAALTKRLDTGITTPEWRHNEPQTTAVQFNTTGECSPCCIW